MGKLLPLIFFIVFVFQFSFYHQVSTTSCIQQESEALLILKSTFTDPSNQLTSWINGTDCCIWDRVTCNNITGHIIELNLFSSAPPYGILSNRIDSSLSKLKFLNQLDLSGNFFNYTLIPDWFSQFKNLKHLGLKNASFSGPIPASLGNLSRLEYLDLSDNMFTGEIPTSFGRLFKLKDLIFRDNLMEGVIPESFGQLHNLQVLDVSKNSFKGIVSEIHFANLSRLQSLFMADNSLLSFEMKRDWVPPFQLNVLYVDSIKGFGSIEFPRWLQSQKELIYLHLVNTSISGPFPTWLRFQTTLYLDLSDNKITGSLPMSIGDQMPNLVGLVLSNNQINGTIPKSICRWKNLVVFVVPKNRLYGTIPSCLFTPTLTLLDVSSNNFSGVIPNSFVDPSSLELVHLADNNFEGEILSMLRNCSSLTILDLQGNLFSGNIPEWIGNSLENLQILTLRGNMFDGSIPPSLWKLPYLQILDLAGNKLVGNIPPNIRNFSEWSPFERYEDLICWNPDDPYAPCYLSEVSQVIKSNYRNYSYSGLYSMVNIDLSHNNLVGIIPSELALVKSLVGLNLSHNNLLGTIPLNMGKAKSLESLDLSFNQLSGPIPDSMSSLSSLGVLKLSNNNFSGRIPRGGHLSTFNDVSTYDGNPYLCGDPLPVRCPNEKSFQPPIGTDNNDDDDNDQKEDKWEKMWLYIIVVIGYAFGFWVVVGILIINTRWRQAYFQFVDETKDKIHTATLVNMAKLKRKMRGNIID